MILMFIAGRGYKSIAKHYGTVTKEQVRLLVAPYLPLLLWQDRLASGTTRDALASVLLEDEIEQLSGAPTRP